MYIEMLIATYGEDNTHLQLTVQVPRQARDLPHHAIFRILLIVLRTTALFTFPRSKQ